MINIFFLCNELEKKNSISFVQSKHAISTLGKLVMLSVNVSLILQTLLQYTDKYCEYFIRASKP